MSGSQRQLPPKKDVFRALLEAGPSVMVHLDPRRDEVAVPGHFKNQPQLILEIGYGTNPPIPDLDFEGEAITCTLSFRRQPFSCRLPWSSVYALVSKQTSRGMIWSDDVPPEVAAQMQPPPGPRPVPTPAPPVAALAPAQPAEQAEQPAAASAPPGEATAPAAEKKKGKKKKQAAAQQAEGPAPAAAQPPSPPPAQAEASPEPKAAPAPAPARSTGPTSQPGQRPKRELPSYLRVIK